jgi:hypothetical protein
MIGLSIEVDWNGEALTLPISPRAAVNFERHFGMALSRAISEDGKFEHLYYLAWECVRLSGRVVKPFDGWLEEVKSAKFVVDDEPAPLDVTG